MSITRNQASGAYRRWQPPSFDGREEAPAPEAPSQDAPPAEDLAAPPRPLAAAEPEAEIPPPYPGVQLPTVEDIERMHEQAREEGRKEGHAEGYAAGHKEGEIAGREQGHAAGYQDGKAQIEAEARRFSELADNLDQALAKIDEEVAEELLGLAIAIARQMVQHTLATHPEAVAETVRAALMQLPQGHAHIRLHPDDLQLVQEHLAEQLAHGGHRLAEDESLTRGGCRVESPGAQVDATMETRWRRVLEQLGREDATWEPDR
ncbi:flagellar assembly protein FliH [Azoarcus sp. TTM-91]|uniref:flagellar assembly protein FliH n=1 Tax=Azoarcus sp. TTM-91 TaxID=2691581 RepID=UPI00145EF2BA|nr:flagellar assembly protein FliH [Azoarcus sp. TTM-91]